MEPVPPYEILTEEQFLKETQKLTQLTAENLGTSDAVSKLLLNLFNWDGKTLIEEHNRAEDKEAFFKEKKVVTKPKAPEEGQTCTTCTSEEFCKMSACGDVGCVGCWSRYFWREMTLKQTVVLNCLYCENLIDEHFISATFEEFGGINDWEYLSAYEELTANKKRLVRRLEAIALKTIVKRNPLVESCPESSCSKIIKVNKAGPCIVKCICERAFCFACTKYPHPPISCSLLSKWETDSIDPETMETLAKVSKRCPNCGQGIIKTDGCIEMQCSSCKHSFCWFCLGDWNTHKSSLGGMCELADVVQKKSRTDEEEKLIKKRFERFHTLYQQQNAALEEEKELHGKLEGQINGSKENVRSPTKAETSLMGAFELLFDAHTTLKYSYVYAFYHFEGKEDESLEKLQFFLGKAANDLREYFDKLELKTEKIEENKPKVEKMCQNLEADIEKLVKFCDGKSAEESRTRKKATEAGTSGGTGEGHSGGKTEEKGADKTVVVLKKLQKTVRCASVQRRKFWKMALKLTRVLAFARFCAESGGQKEGKFRPKLLSPLAHWRSKRGQIPPKIVVSFGPHLTLLMAEFSVTSPNVWFVISVEVVSDTGT
ncbi:hypothetical protein niasHT_000117 [Heterodera trifolii]|uniref:RBR-type E3 ubiquitin transferase n=1 Tax=Heterodera trifolii TaxID=157864 RepID=A0ABD2LSR7_9BILA